MAENYEHNKQARVAIQSLLDGQAPGNISTEACGEWGHVVGELHKAYEGGGTAAVRRVFSALCNAHRSLATLIASGEAPPPAVKRGCPALPAAATAVYAHLAPCGQWLDAYMAFAREAAPRAPDSLHEAAGLFALALTVGRRLCLRVGVKEIFPNLYILWIGETTIHSKTTAFNLLLDLVRRAGLKPLLLPQKLTPQGLFDEMAQELPRDWAMMGKKRQADWLEMRGLATQRGWALDEASFLFDSLQREYNTALLGLILELYECPHEVGDRTRTHGYIQVSEPCLSFFGITTPESMSQHFHVRRHWHDGLWARFALVVPDKRKAWTFFPPQIEFSYDLVAGLKRIHELFPVPHAEVVVQESDDGEKRVDLAIYGKQPPADLILSGGVWDAWKEYARATQSTLLDDDLDPELRGSYGRLATQAIKVAMLLAASDCEALPVRVELRHYARAQEIVERWRGTLHQLWTGGMRTEEEEIHDKIKKLLQDSDERGLLARDIYRALHQPSAETLKQLEIMERSGEVERISESGRNGRPIERWLLRDVTSVTGESQKPVTAEFHSGEG